MKATWSLSVAVPIYLLLGQLAAAGAATGTPSPFLPPYPDYRVCEKCPRYHIWHEPVRLRVRTPATEKRR